MSNITEMILRRYGIAGSIVSETELSGGNVNLTFRVTVKDGASVVDYLVQKINPNALTKPRAAMRNMVLVTDHLRKKGIRTAALLPVGLSGERFLEISRGQNAGYWRIEEYLNAVSVPQDDPDVLYEMARAFGRFNAALADLSPDRLHETILGFHNTFLRFRDLWRAAKRDEFGRTGQVKNELRRLKALEERASEISKRYEAGEFPVRVTHNDTKFNNVLFTSDKPPYGAVVIDFDTVMAGMIAYDFADSVRSVAKEMQPDGSARLSEERFRAVARGYLTETAALLTQAELDAMAPCTLAVTAELAARYLTDYLEGDRYFRITDPETNLRKARLNIGFAEDIDRRMPELTKELSEIIFRVKNGETI